MISINYNLTHLESPRKRISMRNCRHWVGLWACMMVLLFLFLLIVIMTSILYWNRHIKSRTSGFTVLLPGSCHTLNPSLSLKWNSDSYHWVTSGSKEGKRVVRAMSHTLQRYSGQHWAGRIVPSAQCVRGFRLGTLPCHPMPAVLGDQLQSFFCKGMEQGRERAVEKIPDTDLWPPHVLKVLYTQAHAYMP